MRRHRRNEGLGISDTWNYTLRTVGDSLGFTREFTDSVNQEMMDEERIARKHRLEKEHRQDQDQTYPSCSLDDRPEIP
ncbi:hypothetical protein [Pontibacter anaerobius]|uniref:Uncharacterized protein n=1 Tax=Pontibacter anaerobius TaxID=2993940 RepID=A0ABT3R9G4_9BACT|nr:hypothetical protein [Pontibacter anaerobius]MCX2738407.1 hypothetical protein [Pontibacter anaerobius]